MSKANQELSISNTSATSLAPNYLFTCEGQSAENAEQSSTSLILADTGPVSHPTDRTLSLSPNRRIHDSQARCSTLLSLPTSSLLAPAKTFEVFEQQGNTFAFHLTCLWRPLKYIIAEQHRFPPTPLNHLPSKGAFSTANPSSGKRVWPAISLSLPFPPPTFPPLLSLGLFCSLCVTPSPSHCETLMQLLTDSTVCEWERHGANCWPRLGVKGFKRWCGWQPIDTTWLIIFCVQSGGNVLA